MTKYDDISNLFDVTERKTLAVENIVAKSKYLTILFFSQHYNHLDTCPKYCHPSVLASQILPVQWRSQGGTGAMPQNLLMNVFPPIN